MTNWKKIPEELQSVKKRAPYYLEVREGKYRTSYRVFYRGDGLDLRDVLKGEFKTWTDALKEADRVIAKAKYGEKPKPVALVRCETLCDEIVRLKESKAAGTYQQTEIFFRVHIKPYLNVHCPYASELNHAVWLDYKNRLRLKNPNVTLFNHWKFFTMLFRYAFQKGILKHPVKLEYDEQKEDFREKGMIIPDDAIRKMIAAGNRNWRDRVIIGRLTGQRPGLIRTLKKDRVNFKTGVLSVRKEDSKNRRAYEVTLPAPVLSILAERFTGKLGRPDSPYFFPSETDPSRPMDKCLNGWRSMLKRAGVSLDYTPHDLRHTYLTEKFKAAINPALICYQCDLSLEEARRTYLHFVAEDTLALTQESEEKAKALLGTST
jgi:integrase